MSQAPITGRWTPVPDQALLELQKSRNYAAVIVWINMLRDATRHQTWQTSRSVSVVMAETRLSKTTVLKAQCDLVAAGLVTVIEGGGSTRKKITFALTPIENYGKPGAPAETNNSKPIGNW